ncbi:hypothetical protein WJX81_001281 [Elliptochloris bilobata]|uniref:GS catalytic domain-containing protein n=1 Tax=Elliptochloris bilobata TaxID=381761 RepID=A0AAW1RLI4_9CHLO
MFHLCRFVFVMRVDNHTGPFGILKSGQRVPYCLKPNPRAAAYQRLNATTASEPPPEAQLQMLPRSPPGFPLQYLAFLLAGVMAPCFLKCGWCAARRRARKAEHTATKHKVDNLEHGLGAGPSYKKDSHSLASQFTPGCLGSAPLGPLPCASSSLDRLSLTEVIGRMGADSAKTSPTEAGRTGNAIMLPSNNGECRVVPCSRMDQITTEGVGVTTSVMSIQAWADVLTPTADPSGEVRLLPDMGTLQRVPWHQPHGIVLADLVWRPLPLKSLRDADGELPADLYWDCCPRNALRRALRLAREQHGVAIRVGFESEFVLLHNTPGARADDALYKPVDCSLYCQTSGFDAAAPVLDNITAAIHDLGIEVEQLHNESAPGQFEIITAHQPAMKAADNLLFTREAISGVARRAGLLASFLPKLEADQCGNGAHCHFSLCNVEALGSLEAGANLVAHMPVSGEANGGPGDVAARFAAGVLRYLPELMVWTLPSVMSYDRVQPHTWSGAYKVWGVDNKEVPLRLCTSGGPATHNFEIKALDATANPHLALAAIVLAGCEGIKRGWQLPEPCNVDPSSLPSSERLPKSLAEAIRSFQETTGDSPGLRLVMVAALGASLVDAYMGVRVMEEEHFRGCEGSRCPQLVKELVARY